MRTKVHFEESKEKLIQATWKIFLEKGYEKTTLAVIIKELGISKGVFYHYFTDKEDCAKACAAFYAKQCVDQLRLADQKEISAIDRLCDVITGGVNAARENNLDEINCEQNLIFHKMFMVALIKQLTPLYEEIFSYGNETKEFQVAYPKETAEMFLTLAQFYMDDQFFGWDGAEEEMMKKANALDTNLCRCLGIEGDSIFRKE